jgi:hypothetical protein
VSLFGDVIRVEGFGRRYLTLTSGNNKANVAWMKNDKNIDYVKA